MFALVAATTLSLNLIATNTPKRPAAQFLDGQIGLLVAAAGVSAAIFWLAGEKGASELYLFLAIGLGIVAGAVIFVSGYTTTRNLFVEED